MVDIGTEWNLKTRRGMKWWISGMVDIGTEWNLKESKTGRQSAGGGS